MSRPTVLFVLVCSAALSVSGIASAKLSLTAVPSVVDVTAAPGTSVSKTVALVNGGDESFSVRTVIWDWRMTSEGKAEFAPPGSYRRSPAGWISASLGGEPLLNPGDVREATVTFSVPEDGTGAYYGVLFFETYKETDDPDMPGRKKLDVSGRLGVLLMVAVDGKHWVHVVPDKLEITPPTPTSRLRADLVLVNGGDAHAACELDVAVYDFDKNFLGHFKSDPFRVLPGQEKAVLTEWDYDLPEGRYTASATILCSGAKAQQMTRAFRVE